MNLKDLVGPHKLSYAARPDARHPFDADKEAISFYLDRKVYLAIEDDNDGYRSCLGELFVSDLDGFVGHGRYFPSRDVVVRYLDRDEWGAADMIEIIDVVTGHCWLRVGTESIDDYYPSFVATWTPMPPEDASNKG